jgi:hypothetical protein
MSNPNNLLTDWLARVKKAQIAYTRSATSFEKMHYWLGGSIIVLSTLAGASLFATDFYIKVASSIAAVLAGFQTFYRLSERAEKFRVIGSKYGELKMELEQKLTFPPPEPEFELYVESFRERWNKLREEAPPAPQRIWDKIRKDKKQIQPNNA